MTFPSIDPEDVGNTGLLWLLASYGYILYMAANYISEGSELLTLIPKFSGIVGSIVLPLLGAVPDGAIMLFSGLGDIATAQETLSVGVGALAGSTIMLVTLPWSLSVISGRVKFNKKGIPDYRKPKNRLHATFCEKMFHSGVPVTPIINKGAISMILTLVPFFLVQIPATIYKGHVDDLAYAERNYALTGFILCILGFIAYLGYQLHFANGEASKLQQVAVMKKMLQNGTVSLEAAMYNRPHLTEPNATEKSPLKKQQSSMDGYMAEVMYDQFRKYDVDNSGDLDIDECISMFADYNLKLERNAVLEVFNLIDEDQNRRLSFAEIIKAGVIFVQDDCSTRTKSTILRASAENLQNLCDDADDDDGDDGEVEDIPEDIKNLCPEAQQAAIIKAAFEYMAIGTILCIVFSDPMVECLSELAKRLNIPSFYVSFVLAPIAANASEIISSRDQAIKKTSKSISVSLSTLEGAAAMNNTFCLSILLGLIYFRKLAWQYTAETIAIVIVQIAMFLFTRKKNMTMFDAVIIAAIFPLSLVLIVVLEYVGFD